ncbi:MAG: molybdopterin converting factor subunit 1, partial [Rubrobacteraceae bacterium]
PVIFSGMSETENVKVRFFGAAADLAGTRETELQTGETTLEELWTLLAEKHPELSPMRKNLAFAVNEEYARGDALVEPGDEVAVLPPVSGG